LRVRYVTQRAPQADEDDEVLERIGRIAGEDDVLFVEIARRAVWEVLAFALVLAAAGGRHESRAPELEEFTIAEARTRQELRDGRDGAQPIRLCRQEAEQRLQLRVCEIGCVEEVVFGWRDSQILARDVDAHGIAPAMPREAGGFVLRIEHELGNVLAQ